MLDIEVALEDEFESSDNGVDPITGCVQISGEWKAS
jgi:hypothetical protein